ncbi:hypothetical protein LPN04_00980 [Rugamonas sp. A1-17]|nr:hypothetical protein [Rugamonas sp. A1-17]
MKNPFITTIGHHIHAVFRAVEVFHTCHFIFTHADVAIAWLCRYMA